jgi:predicted metal-dependent phosphoesterase TrpH
MVALVARDPDVLRVHFHAHTASSHDCRRSFDAERVREWHRSGGFDVAFITDHGTWAGAELGVRGNPGREGDGTVLLSAVEAWSGGEHLNVLGATAADSLFLLPDEQIDETAVARAVAAGRRSPVMIGTMPGILDTLALGAGGGFPDRALHRVVAIELSDAAPRGLEQSDSTRERVLRIADSLDLALVAGSDNHGWGRTAAAWSLVTIPGWRDMTPDSLGRAIEARIHDERRGAVRVVERGRPQTIRGAVALLNGPVVVWHLFASLAPADRLSWLAWTGGLALAWRAVRRRRTVAPPLLVVRRPVLAPVPLPTE